MQIRDVVIWNCILCFQSIYCSGGHSRLLLFFVVVVFFGGGGGGESQLFKISVLIPGPLSEVPLYSLSVSGE